MVRDEKRRQLGVRGDLLDRSSGLAGEVMGDQRLLLVRDISVPSGSLQALTDTINGPIARSIYEIGRFINERGEATKLSQELRDEIGI